MEIIKYCSKALAIVFPLIIIACGESAESVNQLAPTDGNTSEPSVPLVAESQPALKLSSEVINSGVGSAFTIDVELDAFPVTEGGGVNVRYSPDVLQVKDITINSETWGFATRQGAIDNRAGAISNILVSSYQDVEGKAVVATISFEAIAAGESDIVLSESTMNPFASAGTVINPVFVSSHVIVR